MVILCEFGGGVYVIEQWLATRMQWSVLNSPPAPLSLHDTRPTMLADGLEGSVIVAVNVVTFPEIKDAGFGVTEMIVESNPLVDNCNDPELLRWVLSPA
jgi:hypothetical protein